MILHISEEVKRIASGDAGKYHKNAEYIVRERGEEGRIGECYDRIACEDFRCGIAREDEIGMKDGFFGRHIPGVGKIAYPDDDERDEEYFEIAEEVCT